MTVKQLVAILDRTTIDELTFTDAVSGSELTFAEVYYNEMYTVVKLDIEAMDVLVIIDMGVPSKLKPPGPRFTEVMQAKLPTDEAWIDTAVMNMLVNGLTHLGSGVRQ